MAPYKSFYLYLLYSATVRDAFIEHIKFTLEWEV